MILFGYPPRVPLLAPLPDPWPQLGSPAPLRPSEVPAVPTFPDHLPTPAAAGTPWGHSEVAHQLLGWCAVCADRNALGELHAWRSWAAANNDGDHLIEFTRTGWTLQHPLACRPNLVACPVNRAAAAWTPTVALLGRYTCSLDADGRLHVHQPGTTRGHP